MELRAAGDFLLFLVDRAAGASPPVLKCVDGQWRAKRVCFAADGRESYGGGCWADWWLLCHTGESAFRE
jgi:hypothetical protein